MPRAFVIRPFGKKKDSEGNVLDFDEVHERLIGPALVAAGLEGGTTGEIVDSGNIREDMFKLILEADLVVADITVHNANVFYELGIRHALRKKRTVMIRAEGLKDATPFDLLTDRYTPYPDGDPASALKTLTVALKASLASDRKTDSPVFQMVADLPEADPERITTVPIDFLNEVERAQAAKSVGWLALLATEVRGRRFEWPALKLVAHAQWKLQDWNNALRNWQAIVDNDPDDVEANLALANIYDRLYRSNKKPETLAASDQAIERVLAQDDLGRDLRAEAEALKGRNLKTRWRQSVEAAADVESSRKAAMNRHLVGAYQAYHFAYHNDLNAFYPGLAALQMGSILETLRDLESWKDAFDTDEEADAYKARLQRELDALRQLVPAAVKANLEREPTDTWAKISAADVQFLTSDREQRIIQTYESAVPLDNIFARNATAQQLKLFAQLGIRAQVADAVLARIDPKEKKPETQRPVHLMIAGGHCVDAPGRVAPRFPSHRRDEARAILKTAFEKAVADTRGTHEIHVIASGAPGADLLAHDICREMGFQTTLCLPMPQKEYAASVFRDFDDWRDLFLDTAKTTPILQLSDRAGLPRWLAETHTDPWDRGNRWVVSIASARKADRVSLVVLWDRQEGGAGGTAQMVALAKAAGTIRIQVADSSPLAQGGA